VLFRWDIQCAGASSSTHESAGELSTGGRRQPLLLTQREGCLPILVECEIGIAPHRSGKARTPRAQLRRWDHGIRPDPCG